MRTVPGGLGPGVGEVLRAGRRLYRARPWVFDALMAGATLAVSVVWVNQYPYEPDGRHVYSATDVHHIPFRPVDALGYALTVLGCAAIALRRWRTERVLIATCVVIVPYTGLNYAPTTLAWCPLLIFYTLCTRTTPARAAPYALMVLAVWLQYSLDLVVLSVLLAVAQSVLVIAVTWSFGDQARRLAERNARLASVSEQLRREHLARAGRAVAIERVRIARELHDVVAHHMAVISVQVGLARYVLDSDAATAGEAMDTIADSTREAMLEMRRMLAVLRPVPEDGRADGRTAGRAAGRAAARERTPSVAPASGLAGLESLMDRVRAGGVEVESRVSGEPVPLPPGPDLCCFRVAQESLTNVMKHAAGARAVVEVTYQSHAITLRVTDDGGRVRSLMNPAAAGPPSPESPEPPESRETAGAGHGLVGMRERARIYGGTLTAGRRAAGGFEVVLTLPVGDVPDDPAA